MVGKSRVPSFDEVMSDLKKVREQSVGRLRRLDLPALRTATQFTDLADDDVEPAAIVELLRKAVDTLGGGSLQEAAEYSLGLVDGTALWSSKMRRDKAADRYGIVAETFRKKPEHELLEQVAEGVLAQCHDARLRRTRLDMENHRHPADSRLAVQWVERFEAYYRIWTPVYALAADLEAALITYTHEPSDHYPWDPTSTEPYVPEMHAQAYARSALYHYANYQLELKRFMSKHGGLWLLSDADTEKEVADAIYRVGWHNPLNEDDDSFLRRHLADSRHEEAEHFTQILHSFPIGERIHDEWQAFVIEGLGKDSDEQKTGSQVHLTIQACKEYCDQIDADWLKIADWYRPGSEPARGATTGRTLYEGLVARRLSRESS